MSTDFLSAEKESVDENTALYCLAPAYFSVDRVR